MNGEGPIDDLWRVFGIGQPDPKTEPPLPNDPSSERMAAAFAAIAGALIGPITADGTPKNSSSAPSSKPDGPAARRLDKGRCNQFIAGSIHLHRCASAMVWEEKMLDADLANS
jgi:hypothetical protein